MPLRSERQKASQSSLWSHSYFVWRGASKVAWKSFKWSEKATWFWLLRQDLTRSIPLTTSTSGMIARSSSLEESTSSPVTQSASSTHRICKLTFFAIRVSHLTNFSSLMNQIYRGAIEYAFLHEDGPDLDFCHDTDKLIRTRRSPLCLEWSEILRGHLRWASWQRVADLVRELRGQERCKSCD